MKALLDHLGNPLTTETAWSEAREAARSRMLRANIDAGLKVRELQDWWTPASSRSTRSLLTSNVRRSMRDKARWERSQNSLLEGLVLTSANFVIGTGPRLNMMIRDRRGRLDHARNREIENEFAQWASAIRLSEKLLTMIYSKRTDGEAFGMIINNPKIGRETGISYDLELLEAEQVENDRDTTEILDDGGGGILYDDYGNPVAYPVRKHPGDSLAVTWQEPEYVNADFMIHLFRMDRPGQRRGVPEYLQSLPICAVRRRLQRAILGAYEIAADLAAVMTSPAELDEDGNMLSPVDEQDWFTTIPIENRHMLALPSGASIEQFKPQQPSAEFHMLDKMMILEISRCLNIPYNIAIGDSSEYNYASGRLDHQNFHAANRVERQYFEQQCLNRLFDFWVRIYATREVDPFLADPMTVNVNDYPHTWHWPGQEHVDPAKESQGIERKLKIGVTTRGYEYSKQGQDVDRMDEIAAQEMGFDDVIEYRQWVRNNLSKVPEVEEQPGGGGGENGQPRRQPEPQSSQRPERSNRVCNQHGCSIVPTVPGV